MRRVNIIASVCIIKGKHYNFKIFVYWHWYLLSLFIKVYNIGHDSLVLCALINILHLFYYFYIRYCIFKLYCFSSLLPKVYDLFLLHFITGLFNFSLYFIKYYLTVCNLLSSLLHISCSVFPLHPSISRCPFSTILYLFYPLGYVHV